MTTTFEQELKDALPKLRGVAILMTRDRAQADDLLQDTISQALAAQKSYTLGTNFMGWAYRIMRNRHISLMRRRRFSTVPLDDPAALAVGCAGVQEDRIAQGELARCIKTLPQAQMEALLLVSAAGVSYEEAAERLGCAVGTVKSRVSRARDTLRQLLLEEDEGGAGNDRRTLRRPGGSAVVDGRQVERVGRSAWT